MTPAKIYLALSIAAAILPSTSTSSFTSPGDVGDVYGRERGSLAIARKLKAPQPRSTVSGEFEGEEFWQTNGEIIRDAWAQLEEEENSRFSSNSDKVHNGVGDDSVHNIFDPFLTEAVNAAFASPSIGKEDNIKDLCEEVAPGVHKFQLLQPEGISKIRSYFDLVSSSGIPVRRPNGMNRYGFIVDGGGSEDDPHPVDGAVSLSGLNLIYNRLVDTYFRPMGRMLFPSLAGRHSNDDVVSYGFTIRYRHDEDVQLNEHSDASLFTINVNLNLPNETYGGSSIYFVDEKDKTTKHYVAFEPGMALLHTGRVRHAAQPIKDGERHNLIVWLFGDDGYVRIAPYENKSERFTVKERWTKARQHTMNFDHRIEKTKIYGAHQQMR